jgi:hypothetical protein
MNCEHDPIVEGGGNPCFNCPPIPTQAPMSKVVAVGFGEAAVYRDGVRVIDGEERIRNDEELLTFGDVEEMAIHDPVHDWRIVLNGPLHGETYQRQGPGVWLCVERNDGFA